MAMKVCYNVLNGEVISENRGGVRRDYWSDSLGNTLGLQDSTGAFTDTFDYFPSGTVASRTGTTTTPFQWVGNKGYYRDNAKRTHVRARNFNVNLGRWQEPDPIGFAGGDYNLYRYVKNRFVVVTDPSGLTPDFDYINNLFDVACNYIYSDQMVPYGNGKINCVVKCLIPVIQMIGKPPGLPDGAFFLSWDSILANGRASSARTWCDNGSVFEIVTKPGPAGKDICAPGSGYCAEAQPDKKPCSIKICPSFLEKDSGTFCNNRHNHLSIIIHEILHCSFGTSTGPGNQVENPIHAALNKAAICVTDCRPVNRFPKT